MRLYISLHVCIYACENTAVTIKSINMSDWFLFVAIKIAVQHLSDGIRMFTRCSGMCYSQTPLLLATCGLGHYLLLLLLFFIHFAAHNASDRQLFDCEWLIGGAAVRVQQAPGLQCKSNNKKDKMKIKKNYSELNARL